MPETCRFPVRTIPNARSDAVVGWLGDALKVKVRAPALDGRANEALCDFLAAALDVPRGSVVLIRGAKSRSKLIEVRGLALGDVAARLAAPS